MIEDILYYIVLILGILILILMVGVLGFVVLTRLGLI